MTVSKSRRSRGGFTLIEVLLVLVILVTLSALAVTTFDGIRRNSKINAAEVQVNLFKSGLQYYQLGLEMYPTADQGLNALIYKPDNLYDESKWAGPYLDIDVIPLDPWQNQYQYTGDGTFFQVWSLGPDGQDGTDDDIIVSR